jgi:hypothetical protein
MKTPPKKRSKALDKVVDIGIDPARVFENSPQMRAFWDDMQSQVDAWDQMPPVDPDSDEGKRRQTTRDILANLNQTLALQKKNGHAGPSGYPPPRQN